MINPLEVWHSPEVKELLADFFKANFKYAGVNDSLAEEIINLSWDTRKKSANVPEMMQLIGQKFEYAKTLVTQDVKEVNSIDIFDYSKVCSYLDVGANKLDTINYLMQEYSNIERFIGIDIIPKRGKFSRPNKGIYYKVTNDAKNFPIKNNSIDLINIQFVLHHFAGIDSIRRMLQNCKQALKKGGRLILWEESFRRDTNIKDLCKKNHQINIRTDETLTQRFYNLDDDQKWEFIIANDWIINIKNPHMPWTGEYYVWDKWVELLKEYGLILRREFNLGLRVNGKLKQGVHIIGEFSSE